MLSVWREGASSDSSAVSARPGGPARRASFSRRRCSRRRAGRGTTARASRVARLACAMACRRASLMRPRVQRGGGPGEVGEVQPAPAGRVTGGVFGLVGPGLGLGLATGGAEAVDGLAAQHGVQKGPQWLGGVNLLGLFYQHQEGVEHRLFGVEGGQVAQGPAEEGAAVPLVDGVDCARIAGNERAEQAGVGGAGPSGGGPQAARDARHRWARSVARARAGAVWPARDCSQRARRCLLMLPGACIRSILHTGLCRRSPSTSAAASRCEARTAGRVAITVQPAAPHGRFWGPDCARFR